MKWDVACDSQNLFWAEIVSKRYVNCVLQVDEAKINEFEVS